MKHAKNQPTIIINKLNKFVRKNGLFDYIAYTQQRIDNELIKKNKNKLKRDNKIKKSKISSIINSLIINKG